MINVSSNYPFPFGGVPIPPLEGYPFPLWRSTHSPFGGGRGRFS